MNSPRGRVTTTPLEVSSITLSAPLEIRKRLRTAIQSTRRGTRRTEDQGGMPAGNAEKYVSAGHEFPLGRVANTPEIRFQPATKASTHSATPAADTLRRTWYSTQPIPMTVMSIAAPPVHPLMIWITSLSRPLALSERQRTVTLGPAARLGPFASRLCESDGHLDLPTQTNGFNDRDFLTIGSSTSVIFIKGPLVCVMKVA